MRPLTPQQATGSAFATEFMGMTSSRADNPSMEYSCSSQTDAQASLASVDIPLTGTDITKQNPGLLEA